MGVPGVEDDVEGTAFEHEGLEVWEQVGYSEDEGMGGELKGSEVWKGKGRYVEGGGMGSAGRNGEVGERKRRGRRVVQRKDQPRSGGGESLPSSVRYLESLQRSSGPFQSAKHLPGIAARKPDLEFPRLALLLQRLNPLPFFLLLLLSFSRPELPHRPNPTIFQDGFPPSPRDSR